MRHIPFGAIVSAPIVSGPLATVCTAVNRAVRSPEGETNCCIFAAATVRDVLQAKGWYADVLRVEAGVFPDDRRRYGMILGGDGDGDGSRRPAARPDHWWGHLVAVADGRFLLDPTLDQTGLAPPVTIEITDPRFWSGQCPIFVPIAGGLARYMAFPGRGGFRLAPDFRPCRRREVVNGVIDQLTAIEAMRRVRSEAYVPV
jgi:hypothetical protein